MVGLLCVQTAPSRVRRIGMIVVLGWIIGMLFAAGSAHGQSSAATIERRGLILVMNRPLDSEADQLFRGVIDQSVRWALERQKLGVIEQAAPSYDVATFQNPTDALDSSLTGQVDFILLTEYANRGRELEIRMAWYDPRSGEKTELDTLEPREFIPIDNTVSATTVDFKPSDAASGAASGEASNPARVQPYCPPLPGSEAIRPGVESAPERKRHFEIGLGCAPFVATGAASEYFKLGVMPVLNISYLFQGELSRFGLGLYGGMNYFTATGDLSSAETFLIPMGVSLRYEIGSERYPGVVFGITSGPALLMMISSTGETFLGLTFFGRGSLGVRLPVGRTFALLIEAGYDFYWEQPHPIMGFSPSVSTTIRL